MILERTDCGRVFSQPAAGEHPLTNKEKEKIHAHPKQSTVR
jgi:hypothetical protein